MLGGLRGTRPVTGECTSGPGLGFTLRGDVEERFAYVEDPEH